jgi:hypothetical protein
MPDEEEYESRCGGSFPMCALNPSASHCDLGAMLLPSCYPGLARSSRRGFGLRLRSVVTSVP